MLNLNRNVRGDLWGEVINRIEEYFETSASLPVSPELDPDAIRRFLRPFDFETPVPPRDAVEAASEGLKRWQVHTSHPAYFGLFNPASIPMGVAADALVAAYNPQLAAWSHNPFANEVER